MYHTQEGLLNPFSSNSCIQILQTDLYTFPYWISWENLKNDQRIFPLVIILSILMTSSLDCVLIWLGENWCWSLLALKGLNSYKTRWKWWQMIKVGSISTGVWYTPQNREQLYWNSDYMRTSIRSSISLAILSFSSSDFASFNLFWRMLRWTFGAGTASV